MSPIAAPLADDLRERARPSEDWVLDVPLGGTDGIRLHQAAWSEREPVRAFVHGELVNREDLATSLNGSTETESDAALVLQVYEQGGEPALSRLRGSFAAAECDRANRDTLSHQRDAK